VPELPEVETARSLIADQALHRLIVGVDDADTFVCRPHSPGELRDALTGRTLTAAHRRGKAMWIETSGLGGSTEPGPDLGLHLGMGGRIVVTSKGGDAAEGGGPVRRDAQPRKPEWNRFTLHFADGGDLVLFDKRRLGRVRLNPGIDALGPDAAEVTPAEFRSLITKGSVSVKARLLDQTKIAGVGNLLADEVLWKAKVSPAARTGAEMRHGTVGGRSTWWCSREQAEALGRRAAGARHRSQRDLAIRRDAANPRAGGKPQGAVGARRDPGGTRHPRAAQRRAHRAAPRPLRCCSLTRPSSSRPERSSPEVDAERWTTAAGAGFRS
jgi:formamidopyrimidine-DNA glycosylase